MTIIQVDAPLHTLELTEYEGQYTGRRYAVGHLDGIGVAINPVDGFDGFAASYYGPLPGESYVFGGTYAEAEAVIRAAAYYHDPRVAFTMAAAGRNARAEVLES